MAYKNVSTSARYLSGDTVLVAGRVNNSIKLAYEESIERVGHLVADPEISHSQDTRSMLAIMLDGEKGSKARRSEQEGRETAAPPTRRYEGMDLDLKGGTTWKEGVEGSEVG